MINSSDVSGSGKRKLYKSSPGRKTKEMNSVWYGWTSGFAAGIMRQEGKCMGIVNIRERDGYKTKMPYRLCKGIIMLIILAAMKHTAWITRATVDESLDQC